MKDKKNIEEKKNINGILAVFFKCLRLIFAYSKPYVILTITVNILLGILPAVSLVVLQDILNQVQLNINDMHKLIIMIIVYISLDVFTTLISAVYNYYTSKVSLNLDLKLRLSVLEKALALKMEDFENTETFNMINRASNEGNSKIITFFSSIVSTAQAVLSIFSLLLILVTFNIWIAAPVIFVPIIQYVYSVYISKVQYDIQKARTTKERKSWYISYLITQGVAIKEFIIFHLKDFMLNRFKQLNKGFIQQDLQISKRSTIAYFLLDFLDYIISGFIFFYIVLCGVKQLILVGDVITYTRSVFNVRAKIKSIFSVFSTIAKNALFAGMYFDFMELPVENQEDAGKIKLESIDEIEVRNLAYKYPNSSKYSLKDVNFRLYKGNIMAILGNNGSGKSTLIKLLLGFYDNYEGEILFNGIELRNIDRTSFYALISVLFQDFTKYESTARENVAYGDIANLNNDAKIMQALTTVNFPFGLIDEKKLETQLGFWFDDGKQLSMGEWQKIAIARTIMKNGDFYIFDEPDAALDLNAQNDIVKIYNKLAQDKICLMISHKIQQISNLANEIIVLDKGLVVEQGSYAELRTNPQSYLNKIIK